MKFETITFLIVLFLSVSFDVRGAFYFLRCQNEILKLTEGVLHGAYGSNIGALRDHQKRIL